MQGFTPALEDYDSLVHWMHKNLSDIAMDNVLEHAADIDMYFLVLNMNDRDFYASCERNDHDEFNDRLTMFRNEY